MAIKFKHSDIYSTYFITFTCFEWLSLFEYAKGYDLVYHWFSVLKKEHDAEVVSYVIMPNHLHLIIYFPKQGFSLNKIIANGKRFIGYGIIDRLKYSGNKELLKQLENKVTLREKRKGQLHKIFTDSFDAKAVFSRKFLFQKINYIHLNPVTGKWMLATEYVKYEHSSASFYEQDVVKHFRPVHFMDL